MQTLTNLVLVTHMVQTLTNLVLVTHFISANIDKFGAQADNVTDEQRKVLAIMEKTFMCYITEDPMAKVRRKHVYERMK